MILVSASTPQARRTSSMRAEVTRAGSKRSRSMLEGMTAICSHGVPCRSLMSSAIWSLTAITRSPRAITPL